MVADTAYFKSLHPASSLERTIVQDQIVQKNRPGILLNFALSLFFLLFLLSIIGSCASTYEYFSVDMDENTIMLFRIFLIVFLSFAGILVSLPFFFLFKWSLKHLIYLLYLSNAVKKDDYRVCPVLIKTIDLNCQISRKRKHRAGAKVIELGAISNESKNWVEFHDPQFGEFCKKEHIQKALLVQTSKYAVLLDPGADA